MEIDKTIAPRIWRCFLQILLTFGIITTTSTAEEFPRPGTVQKQLRRDGKPDGLGKFIVTAYSSERNPNQPAANGKLPVEGITCAGPRSIPLGTRVHIEGVGIRVVTDRTARRYDGRFDLFFKSHAAAKVWGKRQLHVQVLP